MVNERHGKKIQNLNCKVIHPNWFFTGFEIHRDKKYNTKQCKNKTKQKTINPFHQGVISKSCTICTHVYCYAKVRVVTLRKFESTATNKSSAVIISLVTAIICLWDRHDAPVSPWIPRGPSWWGAGKADTTTVCAHSDCAGNHTNLAGVSDPEMPGNYTNSPVYEAGI